MRLIPSKECLCCVFLLPMYIDRRPGTQSFFGIGHSRTFVGYFWHCFPCFFSFIFRFPNCIFHVVWVVVCWYCLGLSSEEGFVTVQRSVLIELVQQFIRHSVTNTLTLSLIIRFHAEVWTSPSHLYQVLGYYRNRDWNKMAMATFSKVSIYIRYISDLYPI